MREIKFRAWDKNKKSMIYAVDISHFDLIGTERSLYYYYPEQITETEWVQAQGVESIDNIELMQYTGLKDKNGVEIYEGDIVEIIDVDSESVYLEVVEWGNDGGYFSKKIEWDYFPTIIANGLETRVIGNIYESPDLLKEDN